MIARCYVCQETTPVGHSHHKDPQALGGSDLDRVNLCPNCHQLIHTAAHKILKSPESADNLISMKFPLNSPKYKRCVELVSRVAKKMQEPDKVDTKRVILNLPVATIIKLKDQAAGSKIGWLEYATKILIRQGNKTM